jgi:hypothetical protein
MYKIATGKSASKVKPVPFSIRSLTTTTTTMQLRLNSSALITKYVNAN